MEWKQLEWNGDSNGMEWRQLEWNGDSWNGMETAGMEWRQLEWNGDQTIAVSKSQMTVISK